MCDRADGRPDNPGDAEGRVNKYHNPNYEKIHVIARPFLQSRQRRRGRGTEREREGRENEKETERDKEREKEEEREREEGRRGRGVKGKEEREVRGKKRHNRGKRTVIKHFLLQVCT